MSGGQPKKFKVTLTGASKSGKTALFERFGKKTFSDKYEPTIGTDFRTYFATNEVWLQLWDTAGQERFASLVPSYLKDAQAVVLTVDVSEVDKGFGEQEVYLKARLSEIMQGNPRPLVYLLPTKMDTVKGREAEINARVQQLHHNLGGHYGENIELWAAGCSAKHGTHVNEFFRKVGTDLLARPAAEVKAAPAAAPTAASRAAATPAAAAPAAATAQPLPGAQPRTIKRGRGFLSRNKGAIGLGVGLSGGAGLVAGGISGGTSFSVLGWSALGTAFAVGGATFGVGLIILLVVALCVLYPRHKRTVGAGYELASTRENHSPPGSPRSGPSHRVELGSGKAPGKEPGTGHGEVFSPAAGAGAGAGSQGNEQGAAVVNPAASAARTPGKSKA